jgi:hypothetical protein
MLQENRAQNAWMYGFCGLAGPGFYLNAYDMIVPFLLGSCKLLVLVSAFRLASGSKQGGSGRPADVSP